MIKQKTNNRWFIILTLLIAMMLDILPLPDWAVWFRPQWTLLVFIYWVMAFPFFTGIATALGLGIALDLLNATLLGEHAFAMIIIAYLVIKLHQLIRVYPLMQQTLIIFLLVLLYQMIIYFIQGIAGDLPHSLCFWATCFVSTFLWPWVFILLKSWRWRLQIC